MELSQGQIIHKPNKQELSSMFITHLLNVMHASVSFHKYIPYSLEVLAHTWFTIWNLVKGRCHKPNKQELSSMFMTHRLTVMHASVNFHKYIPYGLGVKAHTWFTI